LAFGGGFELLDVDETHHRGVFESEVTPGLFVAFKSLVEFSKDPQQLIGIGRFPSSAAQLSPGFVLALGSHNSSKRVDSVGSFARPVVDGYPSHETAITGVVCELLVLWMLYLTTLLRQQNQPRKV
jgi:hypothetical protein